MSDRSFNQARSAQPDIIDVFLILLLAAALDIFVFWMATQFVDNPVFQKLPDFVTGLYSGFWTSVATGATGIGLVIVKAIAQRRRASPNYFFYVLATASFLFIAILMLSVVSIYLDAIKGPSVPKPAPPMNAFLLDIPSDGNDQLFNQSDDTSSWIYTYQGKIALRGKIFSGVLESSKIVTSATFLPGPGQTLQKVDVNICHWKLINGNWFVDWSPFHSNVDTSVSVNVPLQANSTINLPKMNFKFTAPDDADLKYSWLCIRIGFNGGYIPVPH